MSKAQAIDLSASLDKEIDGLVPAKLEFKCTDNHYAEVTSPFGSDMLLHIYAFPEDQGSWAPPDGTDRMTAALRKMKERTHLPTDGDWCELSWEPDGLPEYWHKAVRKAQPLPG